MPGRGARPGCHTSIVETEALSDEQRAWLEGDEAVWRRAHAIVAKHPHLDPGDVYHVLINLQRSPSERLRRGLAHARLRPR